MAVPATRKMTIIAQDPSIKDSENKIIRTQADIPYEKLEPGPRGYRVHVVDYDSSQQVLYRPLNPPVVPSDESDLFAKASDKELCENPAFHAQNVYAIVMRLLARFEAALGRRVSWSFGGHQIHVVPHAFADANAYYSDAAHGLFFGYFAGKGGKPVFTCLSHDVIAHEATHALLDGLRESYTLPSYSDQAGFHEGFADIVALLSVFGLRNMVHTFLTERKPNSNYVKQDKLEADSLCDSVLFGLAEQFGKHAPASRYRANCLRRAVARKPSKNVLKERDFEECHIRGEILSAAVLNAFIEVWRARLKSWLPGQGKRVPVERVVEDGADAADQLLTMCIRALDYCPVVDITFGDFLSALLTADMEVLRDDSKYKYRGVLRKQFELWGISPASGTSEKAAAEVGIWEKPDSDMSLAYECVHRESLEQNLDEIFRFIWENREPLRIYKDAYTWVISVRPCVRVAPDGFILKETVSEYRQTLDLTARELGSFCDGMKKPDSMPDDTPVRLHGGGVLIFNEFGHLKYHIHSRIDNPQRQNPRMEYLWQNDIRDRQGRYGFSDGSPRGQRFALMHAWRDGRVEKTGEWDG